MGSPLFGIKSQTLNIPEIVYFSECQKDYKLWRNIGWTLMYLNLYILDESLKKMVWKYLTFDTCHATHSLGDIV